MRKLLRLLGVTGWALQESNLGPSDYESSARSGETACLRLISSGHAGQERTENDSVGHSPATHSATREWLIGLFIKPDRPVSYPGNPWKYDGRDLTPAQAAAALKELPRDLIPARLQLTAPRFFL